MHPLRTVARVRSALIALIAVAAVTVATAETATAAPSACPSSFSVLHDDTIGKLKLQKGSYRITLVSSNALSCAHATDLFRQFLEDFDGKLSDGWRVRASSRTFVQRNTGASFRVARLTGGGGGGGGTGGGGHPSTGTTCPDLFTVQHDDQIGRLMLPKGQYRLTLLAVGRLSCTRASTLFAKFLQDFSGELNDKWHVDTETGTFYKSLRVGFRVKLSR